MEFDKNNKEIDSEKDVAFKAMMFKFLDENKEFKNILITQQKQMSELIQRIDNNNFNNDNNTTLTN